LERSERRFKNNLNFEKFIFIWNKISKTIKTFLLLYFDLKLK
jgi:hypothetical protein